MSQQTESVLNGVLITMSRSFLQYVAECWPWVDEQAQSIGDQVMVIAERQRQDVAEIASLLTEREWFIDFGTFPTEYTDLQFLALEAIFENIHRSQSSVCAQLDEVVGQISEDAESVDLIRAIGIRQAESATALKELHAELSATETSA